jgi:phospholipid/cholesterol/gamma-HCH transport system substrate-binding protein
MAAGLSLVLLAAILAGCSHGGYTLTAFFADSGDLQSRGAVQVADLRVGTVGKITLTKDFRSQVTLHINSGIKIPRGSEAILRTTSLLGEKFVELRALGNPTQGPYLQNGDKVTNSVQQPELEVVADTAVKLLGAVTATDVQTIVATGAQGFGNRGPQLAALIGDLNQISGTLASRTTEIGSVIDNLDRATQTLAAGAPDLSTLLSNLASTTTLLANDRNQAVTALASLTHLAEASDYSLTTYQSQIDREIKQVDAVTATVVSSLSDLQTLLDWLQQFAVGFPKGIFGNYGGIYLRVVPYVLDPRSPK